MYIPIDISYPYLIPSTLRFVFHVHLTISHFTRHHDVFHSFYHDKRAQLCARSHKFIVHVFIFPGFFFFIIYLLNFSFFFFHIHFFFFVPMAKKKKKKIRGRGGSILITFRSYMRMKSQTGVQPRGIYINRVIRRHFRCAVMSF